MSASSHSSPPQYAGCLPVIVRIFWMGLGNFGLFAFALMIGQSKQSLFSHYDILFGSLVVGCIIVRYLDIVHFHGDTADGTPATLQDWRRYVAILVPIALALWLGAHGVAYFF